MREVRRNGANGRKGTNGHDGGLNQEQGYALLDRLTRKHLNIDASTFIQAWRDGRFQDESKYPEAVRLAMMIPLAV